MTADHTTKLQQLKCTLDRLLGPDLTTLSRLQQLSLELELRIFSHLPARQLGLMQLCARAWRDGSVVHSAAKERMVRLHDGAPLGIQSIPSLLAFHEDVASLTASWTSEHILSFAVNDESDDDEDTEAALIREMYDFSGMQVYSMLTAMMVYVRRKPQPGINFRLRILNVLGRIICDPSTQTINGQRQRAWAMVATGAIDFLLEPIFQNNAPEQQKHAALEALSQLALTPAAARKLVTKEFIIQLDIMMAAVDSHTAYFAAKTLCNLMREASCWQLVRSHAGCATPTIFCQWVSYADVYCVIHSDSNRHHTYFSAPQHHTQALDVVQSESQWSAVFDRIAHLLDSEEGCGATLFIASLDLSNVHGLREAIIGRGLVSKLVQTMSQLQAAGSTVVWGTPGGTHTLAAVANLVLAGPTAPDEEIEEIVVAAVCLYGDSTSSEQEARLSSGVSVDLLLILLHRVWQRMPAKLPRGGNSNLCRCVIQLLSSMPYHLKLKESVHLLTEGEIRDEESFSRNKAIRMLGLRACVAVVSSKHMQLVDSNLPYPGSWQCLRRLQLMLRYKGYTECALAAWSVICRHKVHRQVAIGLAPELLSLLRHRVSGVDDSVSMLVVQLCADHCDVLVQHEAVTAAVTVIVSGFHTQESPSAAALENHILPGMRILHSICQSAQHLEATLMPRFSITGLPEFDFLLDGAFKPWRQLVAEGKVSLSIVAVCRILEFYCKGDIGQEVAQLASEYLNALSSSALLGSVSLKKIYLDSVTANPSFASDLVNIFVAEFEKDEADLLLGLLSLVLGNHLALLWPNTSFIESLIDASTTSCSIVGHNSTSKFNVAVRYWLKLVQSKKLIARRSATFVIGLLSMSPSSFALVGNVLVALREVVSGHLEEGKPGACAALMSFGCADAVPEAALVLRNLIEGGTAAAKAQAIHVVKQLCDDPAHHATLLAVGMDRTLAQSAYTNPRSDCIDVSQLVLNVTAKAAVDGLCQSAQGRTAMAHAFGRLYLKSS